MDIQKNLPPMNNSEPPVFCNLGAFNETGSPTREFYHEETPILNSVLKVIGGETKFGEREQFAGANYWLDKEFKVGINPDLHETTKVVLSALAPSPIATLYNSETYKSSDPMQVSRSTQIYKTRYSGVFMVQENAWQPKIQDKRVSVSLYLVRDDPDSPSYSQEAIIKRGGKWLAKE